MEKMSRDLRISILKSGGKKALKEFNRKRRAGTVPMNTGTRVHTDAKHRKPKYKQDFESDLRVLSFLYGYDLQSFLFMYPEPVSCIMELYSAGM